jgi:hypothetical protein
MNSKSNSHSKLDLFSATGLAAVAAVLPIPFTLTLTMSAPAAAASGRAHKASLNVNGVLQETVDVTAPAARTLAAADLPPGRLAFCQAVTLRGNSVADTNSHVRK